MSQNTGNPGPFTVPNSGRWLGSDGAWSTFLVYMGTPPQQFHVLPNFGGQTIYVPRDEDCKRLVNLSDCGTQRGVEIFSSAYSPGFQPNASSTWKVLGDYDLALGGVYGLNGFAKWGNDSAGAGMIRSTDLPKLENVAVVAYVAPDFWIGQLGLSPSTIDMNAGNQPHSFLRRMKDEGHIPSLSFGYQAGAPYRFTKVPGSLILGGYDRSRQGNKTMTFTSIQDIIVGVQAITTTFANGTTKTMSTDGFLATIDTNAAEIWLPRPICDIFESTFKLSYFDLAYRYTVNDTARAELQRTNPTISFRIGSAATGGDIITIDIPYAAFDQQLKFPIIQGQTNYFPLRRAANDSQIALGRVFLQEVYLSVDWERDIFNLSQAVFSDRPPPADLVTIDPKNRTDNLVSRPGPGAGRLSPGAIAGVVIAAVVLALLAGGLVWWSRRKQRKAKAKGSVEATQDSALDDKKDHGSFEPGVVSNKPYGQHTDLELDGGMVPEMYAPHGQSEAHHVVGMHDQMMEPIEADSRSPIYELPSPDHHFPKRMG